MNTIKNLLIAIAIICVSAANTVKDVYVVSKDYNVKIEGTYNTQKHWVETVENVIGNCDISWNGHGSYDLNTMNIKMDAQSIKNNVDLAMNNNTHQALKSDANPGIIFTLDKPIHAIKSAPYDIPVSAIGQLTIAGVTHAVNMNVKIFMPEQGKLVLQGSRKIKMTDYGIIPPASIAGSIKSDNDITVSFNLTFLINSPLAFKK